MTLLLFGGNMPETMPLTITPEAQDFIAENGLQAPLQKMLDEIPSRIPLVRGVRIFLQDPYDLGGGPSVILDVKRDEPKPYVYEGVEWNWNRWVVENFPPEEFHHFCLICNFGPDYEG
jgi:hypothetical protein